MIKKGDELKVFISDLNSEGKGVAKLEDGFVIFSERTLPGDTALVKIAKKKSNFAEAKLIEIAEPSQFRIIPECSYFGICGGCKLQNYQYEKQVEFKTNVVKMAFEKIGGLDVSEILQAVNSSEIFFYRNKMEFSFSDDEWKIEKNPVDANHETDEAKFALGLHVPKFHSKIIDINECYLQSEISNGILNFTREFFKNKNVKVYSTKTQSGFLRFLVIRQSRNTDDLMVNIITSAFEKELIEEYAGRLRENFPSITAIVNSVSEKKAQVAVGEYENVLYGTGFIIEKIKNREGKEFDFRISAKSFFQTNTRQSEKLFEIAIEMGEFSKSDKVLDLYCGTGSISILISEYAGSVLGVELIDEAVSDAKKNAKLNGIENTDFLACDIKDFLENEKGIGLYNKIILDPPRSGLHPKICEILSRTDFEKIIYVSCNPHTQARDLKIILSEGKYFIDKIQPVDMFPHTYHIENVVRLCKSRN